MKYILNSFVVAAFITVISVSSAFAHYVVKQDPEFGYHFSVPDTWYEVSGMAERLSHVFMARGQNDGAGCSIYSGRDTRFLIQTSAEMKAMVEREFTQDALITNIARMNIGKNDALNETVIGYQMGGLGDGFATYMMADYTSLSGLDKRSIMFATLYGDMQMIVSCQASKESFEKRFPEFMGVITSLNFKDFYRPYAAAYYRDFLGTDRSLFEIWVQNTISNIKAAF